MKTFDENRLEMLGALFVDSHRPDSRFMENSDLVNDYNVHMADNLFNAVIAQSQNLLRTANSKDGAAACLAPEGYADVYREILTWIEATTIEVNWQKEEVLTDAKKGELLPLLRGWKLLTFAQTLNLESTPATAGTAPTYTSLSISYDDEVTYDSSSWTGLRATAITITNKKKVQESITQAKTILEGTNLSNEQKAQALTLLKAAEILIDAPEPPSGLIWELIHRASSVCGVAGLFLSIFQWAVA